LQLLLSKFGNSYTWRSMAGELYLTLWKDEKGLKYIYDMSDVGGKGLAEIRLLQDIMHVVESHLGKEDPHFRNLAKEKYPLSSTFVPDTESISLADKKDNEEAATENTTSEKKAESENISDPTINIEKPSDTPGASNNTTG